MTTKPEFSTEAVQVLACLPRAPTAAVVSEIAQDVFQLGQTASYAEHRAACGRVRRALNEIGRHFRIYREYRPYDQRGRRVPWGQRERYGIARDDWQDAQAAIGLVREAT